MHPLPAELVLVALPGPSPKPGDSRGQESHMAHTEVVAPATLGKPRDGFSEGRPEGTHSWEG